ncbi:Ectonucleotide pyrophosphatase/phosphodiesterase member 6 [Clonorchis sinensis]|uniref:glycerophosphocholine cholinephosphodiesterase n=2 Tax=Clonorchis sinensis TaxID=79923 RepID=G7YCI3_CLOSI|nr:Ectonucleotide pyrophosphatase/phosphodiesterase member 6 [Clonorchis sinensis]GAA50667.1 ectonucleotide pyrophosphatase/phosphodiesterase family member 6 [Clonorchis sinensis]
MLPRQHFQSRFWIGLTPLFLVSFHCVVCVELPPPDTDYSRFPELLFANQMLSSPPSMPTDHKKSPLLLLLLDSFRWDLLDHFAKRTNHTLRGFNRLITGGGYMKQVRPVFPAECHPNIMSLLTGLYPAEHGMLFTKMYDERRNRSVGFMEQDVHSPTPDVKTKLAKHGRMHVYHLPFCESLVSEWTSCEPQEQSQLTPAKLEKTLGRALERLRSGQSDVTVVYYDKLDYVGHEHGPLSDQLLLSHLPALDHVIDRLVDRLTEEAEIRPYLVVTADHGMTEVLGSTESLDRLFSGHQVKKVINRGSTVSIWPRPEEHEKILLRLSSPRIKRFSTYVNESIPAEWHSGGALFPPILLVAKPGFVFNSEFWPLDLSHTNLSSLKGAHGYDTTHPDMHVPLFLFGPRIKPSSLYQGIPVDQLYSHQLIASLSTLRPAFQSSEASSNPVPLQLVDSRASVFQNGLFIATLTTIICLLCLVVLLFSITFVCRSVLHFCTPLLDVEEKLIQPQGNLA